jgi:hypothetical protein
MVHIEQLAVVLGMETTIIGQLNQAAESKRDQIDKGHVQRDKTTSGGVQ